LKDNGYWLGIREEKLHLKPLKPINTGIGRALRSVIDLSLAESFLAVKEIGRSMLGLRIALIHHSEMGATNWQVVGGLMQKSKLVTDRFAPSS
jgi:hypothetical protein